MRTIIARVSRLFLSPGCGPEGQARIPTTARKTIKKVFIEISSCQKMPVTIRVTYPPYPSVNFTDSSRTNADQGRRTSG